MRAGEWPNPGLLNLWPMDQMQPAEPWYLACVAPHRWGHLAVREWWQLIPLPFPTTKVPNPQHQAPHSQVGAHPCCPLPFAAGLGLGHALCSPPSTGSGPKSPSLSLQLDQDGPYPSPVWCQVKSHLPPPWGWIGAQTSPLFPCGARLPPPPAPPTWPDGVQPWLP